MHFDGLLFRDLSETLSRIRVGEVDGLRRGDREAGRKMRGRLIACLSSCDEGSDGRLVSLEIGYEVVGLGATDPSNQVVTSLGSVGAVAA